MQQSQAAAPANINRADRVKCDPFVEFITAVAIRPAMVEALLRRTEWVLTGLARQELIKSGYTELELDWSADLARLSKLDPDSLDRETVCMPLGDFRELVIDWRNIVLRSWRNPK